MSNSEENRVLSAKTSRGPRNPSMPAGSSGIVQRSHPIRKSDLRVEDVNRLLKLGKLLRSALTLEELEEIWAEARS